MFATSYRNKLPKGFSWPVTSATLNQLLAGVDGYVSFSGRHAQAKSWMAANPAILTIFWRAPSTTRGVWRLEKFLGWQIWVESIPLEVARQHHELLRDRIAEVCALPHLARSPTWYGDGHSFTLSHAGGVEPFTITER